MSGGGGGGYGGPTRQGGDCNIIERVALNSPKPAVVTKLKVGDVLAVEERGGTLIATYQGADAGALTPNRLLDLLDCIRTGSHYRAIVQRLVGGLCEVEIRPK
jgi:hypothetical protein